MSRGWRAPSCTLASCICGHGLACFRRFNRIKAFKLPFSRWVRTNIPATVPWLLSFLNGMTILGFLFARFNRLLPGKTGLSRGLSFGLIGWLFMGLIFFPLIGLGPFAIGAGLGIAPAMMSLGMVLTYSVVLGTVYVALDSRRP